jgi:hypothetical protein
MVALRHSWRLILPGVPPLVVTGCFHTQLNGPRYGATIRVSELRNPDNIALSKKATTRNSEIAT